MREEELQVMEETRLVSFLVEGDDVVSCEVCLEAFLPDLRPPKLLPCGHNFCEHCLFSLCCHQQYYLLDSINCPTCRAQFSTTTAMNAPTNYDLCKILENVQRGRELNVTVIHVPDTSSTQQPSRGLSRPLTKSKSSLTPACRALAEVSSSSRGHPRCVDCCRRVLARQSRKAARFCEQCFSQSSVVLLSCLECCVNAHNGHALITLDQLQVSLLKAIRELRELRVKVTESGDTFDVLLVHLQSCAAVHVDCATLLAAKQNQLTECLSELDEALKDLEATPCLPPARLAQVRNRQLHNHAKLVKLINFLEKCKETPRDASRSSLAKPPLASSSAAMRQSRLCLRGDSWTESLTALLSLLRPSESSLRLSELVQCIGPRDTIEERVHTLLSIISVLNDLLDEENAVQQLSAFEDAFLQCFNQLNSLSRKRHDVLGSKKTQQGETRARRLSIWKAVQQTYTQLLKIASKKYPSFHPERVDLVDDWALLCHVFADVVDQASVAVIVIEAARARASQSLLPEEQRERQEERLKLIDEHLLECRRVQKLEELRSSKQPTGRLKRLLECLRPIPRRRAH